MMLTLDLDQMTWVSLLTFGIWICPQVNGRHFKRFQVKVFGFHPAMILVAGHGLDIAMTMVI